MRPGERLRRSPRALLASVWCTWQRNGSVLLWMPLILLGPLVELDPDPAQRTFQVGLLLVVATSATVATATSGRRASRRWVPKVALLVQAACTFAGATQGDAWLPLWTLLAITTPAVLRRVWLGVALALVTASAMWAASLRGDEAWLPVWGLGFVVLLAGVATTAVLRLVETIEELRRTRGELARSAVLAERERFSRDLHDLLGHTLSVMVVKAQAVRRLADRDPAAAADHARDVERIGREALEQVREAVDAMRASTLADEVDGARRALNAAGISTEVSGFGRPVPKPVDETFSWVVREATTNVLRHSGASWCRLELDGEGDGLELSVRDDGAGGAAAATGRRGGLDGLRERLLAAGGDLEVDGAQGFRLTARLPELQEAR